MPAAMPVPVRSMVRLGSGPYSRCPYIVISIFLGVDVDIETIDIWLTYT